MYKYDAGTATAGGEFSDGDDTTVPPIPRTMMEAKWPNMIQRELLNVLAAAGVEPAPNQFDQVVRSIKAMIGAEAGHVGQILTMAGRNAAAAPPGTLFLDGAELNRTAYSELWAWAQQNARIVTDFFWLAELGNRPAFSDGNGSTTFRIPDVRGLFLRWWGGAGAWDSGRTAMTMQQDALQNITGNFQLTTRGGATSSGVFADTQLGSAPEEDQYGSYNRTNEISFNASRVARTAAETRSINAAFPAFIRYKSIAA